MFTSKYMSPSVILSMYDNKHCLQYFCLYKFVAEYLFPQLLHLSFSLLKGRNNIGAGLDFKFGVGSKLFSFVSSIM
jgi:hypothetical protein